MKEYLKAQSKTNEAIVGDTFSTDELMNLPNRFSKSDFVIGAGQTTEANLSAKHL